jgi:hypothetical protein
MHIVLKALGIGPGDEVITPSMTWVSTVNLIVLAGARPVFADVDRHTLMVTAETVAEKITSRTRLIIPVHFAGAPADDDPYSGTGLPGTAISPWYRGRRPRHGHRIRQSSGRSSGYVDLFLSSRSRISPPEKAEWSAPAMRDLASAPETA